MIDRETGLLVATALAVVALYAFVVPAFGVALGIPSPFASLGAGEGSLAAGGPGDDPEGGGYDTAQTFHRLDPSVWNDSVPTHNDRSAIDFREVADDAGLDYQAVQTYNSTQETNGNKGVYAADYDRDGWTDVLAVGGEQPALFRNTGGGFERTEQLPTVDGIVQSALWVDFDNDGWRDLILFAVDDEPIVLENDEGTLHSTDVGFQRSLLMPQGATAADFDGDGCPGVFIYQYGHWGIEHPYGQYNYSVPLERDNGAGNGLLTGDCESLTDETREANVRGTAWSLAASAVDLTGDGDQDIHVTNDFNHDVVYLNEGNGTFERRLLGDRTNRNGMSSEIADVNGDGLPDIFVTNIFFSEYIRNEIEVSLDLRAQGNNLLLNRGNGTFEEAAADYGLRKGGWGWAAVAADFDHDGDRDLVHTTRMISRSRIQDYFLAQGHTTIDRYLRFPVVRERTDDGFVRLNASALGLAVSNGRGLAQLDYDRDGDADLVMADSNGQYKLYENAQTGDGNALQVRLAGAPDQTPLGAEVTVAAGDRTQTRWYNAQVDFLSQDSLVQHFGTADADAVSVTVRWPDGTEQTLPDVSTGQRVVVSQDGVESTTPFEAS